MKKRFDENPGKRSEASRKRPRSSTSDGASDLIKAKKVRFKEAEAEENHRPSHTFDGCPAPCEVTEAPQCSNDPKTSEYAFFKKLKEYVGGTSRPNPVDREDIPSRSLRPSNNLGEVGSWKYKDVTKSETGDASSFPSPKDAALENSDANSKVQKDHEWFKSSVLIKTPTTIDLDSFLSINTNASTKPETQCRDQGVFSFKRLKLKQQIVKILFTETNELPKECDLISLLLRRLLPENCENAQSESLNRIQEEIEDKIQLSCLPHSTVQFEGNWVTSRKLLKPEDGCFLHNDDSPARSLKFRERFPSCQTVEDVDHSGIRHVDRMVLAYTRNDGCSSSNDIDPESWPNNHGDGNHLMWRNQGDDYCTETWSNTFQERNMLKWRDDDDDDGYSTLCSTDTNTIQHDVHSYLSQNGVGSSHSSKFRGKVPSYPNPDGHYGSIIKAIGAERSSLKYRCDVANSPVLSSDRWCDSAVHGSFERFGASQSSNLKDYAEPSHPYDFEFRREPCPLLLHWGAHELDMQESSQTNMQLDLYAPSSTDSEDHLHGLESNTSMGICSSSSCSSKFQDHVIHRYAPLPLLYGPAQVSVGDYGFLKDIFRDSHLLLLPQNYLPFTENMAFDWKCSSMEPLLLPQSSDSDLGLKSDLLTGFSDKEKNISTGDFRILKQENSRLKLPFENENTSGLEDWSLMNVQIPLRQEVSLPLQLHQVRWMDTEAETCSDSGTITNYL